MANGLNRLTARGVANLQTRGRHADGGGLYLQIDGNGSKQWTFRFQIGGQRSEMGLGGLDSVSLADARKAAARFRAEIANGRNPLELRREAQAAERAAADAAASVTGRTFREVADATIAAMEGSWRNEMHRAQWRSTLTTYADRLMDLDVADIKTEHILARLQPIWAGKPETASRLRGRIESVLNAARARGLIPEERANPARWRGHLDHLFPRRTKLSRGHHASLQWQEAPAFMQRLPNVHGGEARIISTVAPVTTSCRSVSGVPIPSSAATGSTGSGSTART